MANPYFAQIFAFFLAPKLTATCNNYWVNHGYPLFCPNFCLFSASKLTASCNSHWINHSTPSFAQIFAFFLTPKLTATCSRYCVNHDYRLFCLNFLPFFLAPKLTATCNSYWVNQSRVSDSLGLVCDTSWVKRWSKAMDFLLTLLQDECFSYRQIFFLTPISDKTFVLEQS